MKLTVSHGASYKSVLLYSSQLKLMPAGTTNLPWFQGAQPDHGQAQSRVVVSPGI